MTFTYDIGDDDYPDYAKKAAFSMPTTDYSVVVARRTHQSGKRDLTGWVLHYVGDDPESDWTLYKPGYCCRYPWDHNPEGDVPNIPDASNDVKDIPWKTPTGSIERYMESHYILLLDDERIIRTIERYR